MIPNETKDGCDCSVEILKLVKRAEVMEEKIKMLCDSMQVEFRDGLHLVEKDWE